jgi:hypothetical protein
MMINIISSFAPLINDSANTVVQPVCAVKRF